ncbi:MAG: hypothetical protein ACE14T_12035 [Syntrophales bacterium]
MCRLELTAEEAKELLEILERYRPDLRIEVANTDDREFRRYLKRREAIMGELINRLKAFSL